MSHAIDDARRWLRQAVEEFETTERRLAVYDELVDYEFPRPSFAESRDAAERALEALRRLAP